MDGIPPTIKKKKKVVKKLMLQNQAHNICVLTNWMCQS